MKNKIRPYFSFSKKERTGILVLVILCLLLSVLPYFIPTKPLEVSIGEGMVISHVQETDKNAVVTKASLFSFNPNTIDLNTWMKLGLSEKLAQRIINYRNKGGRFRQATDLRKIWGILPEQADALIPYVVLPVEKPISYPKPLIIAIDINKADQQAWEALPGIGEKLAQRIIRYREQVGGFAMISELHNVYGLKDSLLIKLQPYLLLNNSSIPKLSLNRASAFQLVQKTGISIEIARLIVKWRMENGAFTSWGELEKIAGFDAKTGDALKKAFQLE